MTTLGVSIAAPLRLRYYAAQAGAGCLGLPKLSSSHSAELALPATPLVVEVVEELEELAAQEALAFRLLPLANRPGEGFHDVCGDCYIVTVKTRFHALGRRRDQAQRAGMTHESVLGRIRNRAFESRWGRQKVEKLR